MQAVLFDLDGTLIDSALDIVTSCNKIAQNHGYAPLPVTRLHPLVGRGSRGIMAQITGLPEQSDTIVQLRNEVLDDYAHCGYPHTRLFAELRPLIQAINSSSLVWGVVTSKPRHHSLQILQRDPLLQHFALLVSLDEVKEIKPSPEGLLLALQQLHIQPQDALYVGDNRVDVVAAQRAGIACIGVGYGYCSEADHPTNYQPDHYAETPSQLVTLLARLLGDRIPQCL